MSNPVSSLLRPDDDAQRQAEKLRRIAAALVKRAETAAAALSRDPPRHRLEGSERPGALFVVAARQEPAADDAPAAPDTSQEARDVIDSLPLGVCIFDAAAKLVFWNRRADTLAQAGGYVLYAGSTFLAMTDGLARARPEDREPLRRLEAWSERRPPRSPLAVELRARTGKTLDLRAQDMTHGGMLLCLDDVTSERAALRALEEINDTLETRVQQRTVELSAARDAAEQANQAKSRFLAAAGHDLLQPLNAARLFVDALRQTGLDAEQRRIADRLGAAFSSVDGLLGAILDISRLELADEPPHLAAFNLDDVLDAVRDEFEPAAADKGLELRVVPCGAAGVSEPPLLQRALNNLVANAIRYTESGRVLVGVRRQRSMLAIEVHDTGPGIAPEHQAAIFEEFRRLGPHESLGAPPKDEDGPGVGLGLAIVERACSRLGHRVELESRPGRGTVFRILVPTREALMKAKSPPAVISVEIDAAAALVILGPGSRRARLVQRLEGWGVKVLIADDASEAIAAAADLGACPDLILTEPQLTDGEDGLAVIRTLRAYFGVGAAALLVEDPAKSPALGRLADAEDVDLLPVEDDEGHLKAAVAIARRF
ncbi:MAG: ATP-binding protein [Pseudomonadota bacterium]